MENHFTQLICQKCFHNYKKHEKTKKEEKEEKIKEIEKTEMKGKIEKRIINQKEPKIFLFDNKTQHIFNFSEKKIEIERIDFIEKEKKMKNLKFNVEKNEKFFFCYVNQKEEIFYVEDKETKKLENYPIKKNKTENQSFNNKKNMIKDFFFQPKIGNIVVVSFGGLISFFSTFDDSCFFFDTSIEISTLSFSPCGCFFSVGYVNSAKIDIFCVENEKKQISLYFSDFLHYGQTLCSHWSENVGETSFLCFGGEDDRITTFKAEKNENGKIKISKTSSFFSHCSFVTSCYLIPFGGVLFLFTSSFDGFLKIWKKSNKNDQFEIYSEKNFNDQIYDMVPVPQQNLLLLHFKNGLFSSFSLVSYEIEFE